jgi:S1-C subfamily serine protease
VPGRELGEQDGEVVPAHVELDVRRGHRDDLRPKRAASLDRPLKACGDVVVEFDGKPIRTPGDLRLYAGTAGVGKTVTLTVVGDSGKRREVEVTLGEMPAR